MECWGGVFYFWLFGGVGVGKFLESSNFMREGSKVGEEIGLGGSE